MAPTAKAEATAPAIETHTITASTMRHMHGALRLHGLTADDAVYAYLTALLGRPVTSRKTLTEADGRAVIADCADAAAMENPGGHGSLAAALVAIQAELPKVPKSNTATIPGKNGGAGYSYKYADLGDVTDAALPLLTSHGVAFTCCPRITPSGSYELVGYLVHVSGEQMEGALPLFGRQAQELGSAITYGRRYLLGTMTGLVTDEDEDGSIAAAAKERAQPAPPPWNGPSTQQLLDRLAALAIEQGTTDEAMSAKWRERHGGLSLDAMAGLDPWDLQPLIGSIEEWIASPKNPANQKPAATEGDQS